MRAPTCTLQRVGWVAHGTQLGEGSDYVVTIERLGVGGAIGDELVGQGGVGPGGEPGRHFGGAVVAPAQVQSAIMARKAASAVG